MSYEHRTYTKAPNATSTTSNAIAASDEDCKKAMYIATIAANAGHCFDTILYVPPHLEHTRGRYSDAEAMASLNVKRTELWQCGQSNFIVHATLKRFKGSGSIENWKSWWPTQPIFRLMAFTRQPLVDAFAV